MMILSRSRRSTASAVGRHGLLYPARNTPLQKVSITVSISALEHAGAVAYFSSLGTGNGRNSLGPVSHFSSRGSGGNRKPPMTNRVASGVGLVGSGALLLWGKGKYIFGALKLGKLATLGSMFVTVGTYSMFFGLPYAVGMVGLILLHESGHAVVMLKRGIPFSPMLFVPFVGATIAMKRRPQDAWEDALVAFGGPLLGSIGALGCSLGGNAVDSQLLYALADFGYMINLFNLLPIGMMGKLRLFLFIVLLA
jgi:hypothetical protein